MDDEPRVLQMFYTLPSEVGDIGWAIPAQEQTSEPGDTFDIDGGGVTLETELTSDAGIAMHLDLLLWREGGDPLTLMSAFTNAVDAGVVPPEDVLCAVADALRLYQDVMYETGDPKWRELYAAFGLTGEPGRSPVWKQRRREILKRQMLLDVWRLVRIFNVPAIGAAEMVCHRLRHESENGLVIPERAKYDAETVAEWFAESFYNDEPFNAEYGDDEEWRRSFLARFPIVHPGLKGG